MNFLFLKILNMSIAASWLILAVLVFRRIFKKAPKWISVMLWGIVGIRLLCPFSIESALSLVPSKQTIPECVLYGNITVQTGIKPIDRRVKKDLLEGYDEGITVPVGYGEHVVHIWAIVWGVGAAILLFYAAASYWNMHRKLRMAVLLKDNIFQSEYADSPFVFGIVNPRIYIPYSLDVQNIEYVAAHERAHIRRKDHWWKPLGFLLLSVYWFNPLVWLSYELLCRDIELACDEKVIRKLENGQRADYSKALLECSVDIGKMAAFPIHFGEVGVKGRIKNILNYKKTTFGIIVGSVIACVAVTACFLTNPIFKGTESMVPTEADIKGVFDSYLFVTIEGKTYRYEHAGFDDGTHEKKMKNKLLSRFTENAYPDNVTWEVYSLKNSPDYSKVLALAGKDKIVYHYSPSKRSDTDTLQQAKKDGCVVMENGDVTFGQQTWRNFVKDTAEGKTAFVKLAHYYTLEPESCSKQYYEAYKEDYPVLYSYELTYDGKKYILHAKEGDTMYYKSYQYMIHDTGDKLSLYADYDSYERYVLTNDDTVTYQDIWQSMISSQAGDLIEHFTVYTDLT